MSPARHAHLPIEHQTGKEPTMAHVSLTPKPMTAPLPGAPVVLALDLGTTTGWASVVSPLKGWCRNQTLTDSADDQPKPSYTTSGDTTYADRIDFGCFHVRALSLWQV